MANADNGFYFLNHTLNEERYKGARLPQMIDIDVGDLEDDPYYAQLGAALQVAEKMIANSPQMELDKSLFFTLANGQVHGSWNCLTRTWNSLVHLNPAQGSSRNPNPPSYKSFPNA